MVGPGGFGRGDAAACAGVMVSVVKDRRAGQVGRGSALMRVKAVSRSFSQGQSRSRCGGVVGR